MEIWEGIVTLVIVGWVCWLLDRYKSIEVHIERSVLKIKGRK